QLRGPNYEEWARAMKTSLRVRRKFGFIDETIKQPTEAELEDWWTVQSMLVSWIMNTIEPSLRTTISYVEEASALWKDIKERFSVANGPRIQQLKSELAGCRQEGLSIVSYYEESLRTANRGNETKREVMSFAVKTSIGSRARVRGKDKTINRPKFEGKRKGTMTQQQKPNPPEGRGRGGQPHANAASVSGALELGDVVHCLMGFPNGDQAVATKSRIVNLDGKIKLLNDYTSRIQIGAGELREGLYYFGSAASASALKKLKDVLFDLWHKRLGHPSAKIVELLPDVGSHSTSNLVNKGGYHTLSTCGASYFLTIVDDYSREVWIYLLKNKTEAPLKLLNFFAIVERQYNKKVKIVRRTPQQNGRVEHKHRHILNVARALRFQANLPIDFWGECVLTAGGVWLKKSDVNQNDDVSESNNTNSNISSSQHDVDATVDVGLTAITTGSEPTRFSEAVQHHCWREAMKKELNALENYGTWTYETLPPGKKAIGSKWVFKIKYNSDGTIERHKARLVILGNNQVEGIDYNDTFAHVAKMVTVRTFLVVAAARNWELHQMDVHNAFLHEDLEEEVYMKLPQGLKSSRPGTVCHLRKSLYGLKQAPRCWFAKLATALKRYGFVQSCSDYSLFTLNNERVRLNVLVYVDDLSI
ncbi:retrovirus-related pol polyprotein from transposon TNT 1-94, partial [Tanacetum coccineum]